MMALQLANVETKEVLAENKTFVVSQCAPARTERLLGRVLKALNIDDTNGIMQALVNGDVDGASIGLHILSFLKGADSDTIVDALQDTLKDVKLKLDDGTTRDLLSTDVERVSTLMQLHAAWFQINVK